MTDATARELLQRNIKVYSKQQIFTAYKSRGLYVKRKKSSSKEKTDIAVKGMTGIQVNSKH